MAGGRAAEEALKMFGIGTTWQAKKHRPHSLALKRQSTLNSREKSKQDRRNPENPNTFDALKPHHVVREFRHRTFPKIHPYLQNPPTASDL